ALQQAKITAVQFFPEFLAVQVFQPAGTQVTTPVFPYPTSDRLFTEIAAGLFAFDPFKSVGFFFAVFVDAGLIGGDAALVGNRFHATPDLGRQTKQTLSTLIVSWRARPFKRNRPEARRPSGERRG